MKTNLLLLAAIGITMQACAVQGSHSFSPTGITLNKTLKLGNDALGPNYDEQNYCGNYIEHNHEYPSKEIIILTPQY